MVPAGIKISMPSTSSRHTRHNSKYKRRPCHLCGKVCSEKGLYEHIRHHCPKNAKRTPRVFGRETCPICGKTFNAHYMRVHMATQHTGERAVIGRPRTPERFGKMTKKESRSQHLEKLSKSSSPRQSAPKERERPETRLLSDEEARRRRVFERMARLKLEPMAPARDKKRS